MIFQTCTFLPDGKIYDSGAIAAEDYLSSAVSVFGDSMHMDSRTRESTIESASGKLKFVWCGSAEVGVFSFLLDDLLVNCGLCLPGKEAVAESDLLQFYVSEWHNFNLVKEIGANSPFSSALDEKRRPFMCSINWATVTPDIYNAFADYDLYVSSIYFNSVSRKPPIRRSALRGE